MEKKLIVTHHAPDLDAIGAVWILKRFDAIIYADAKLAFVDPGEKISIDQAQELGFELHNVAHVDTGMGRFDHHQPDKGSQRLSATMLVRDHVIGKFPDLEHDEALNIISDFTTEIDHFEEIFWPDAGSYRHAFMIHELIKGIEHSELHDDESQLHFGLQCLDNAYATLNQQIKAKEIISEKGQEFKINGKKCIALETRNDETIKMAQKQGFELVIRKDSKLGHVRIKVRPDSEIILEPLFKTIIANDQEGTWFYHPGGKMLINGSIKHTNQTPTKLSLEKVILLTKESLSYNGG